MMPRGSSLQGIDTVLKAHMLLRRPTRDKDLGQSVKSPTPGRTLGRRASDIKRQALGGAPALLNQMTELKVMYLKSLTSAELKEFKIKPSTFLLPEATVKMCKLPVAIVRQSSAVARIVEGRLWHTCVRPIRVS